ncbi:nitroreductase/quinone reductase family protein [Mycolicibacterium porcinum]|uniref:Nitroreductase family deazaflavin-dependent oxidoreductase n=1 Tax=Mycolicibacterium porcinum TaxID=39693 RepID=A0AAW5SVB4_9MYCO|nr:nitroreductase/quinone reductase family protein [Mycolicibacterium porcinum]MCV7386984.1 nitroreductase family deazaflavin-dependent oxidoreductase [Mycolicibacterium porcinum]ORB42435.1 hypothetical protein BST41_06945 [Mycolicibacterium porcinum]CDO32156.1 deazaflavin-dependent oxidoreductase, nitroreductase family [Mycolicibacterium vulneris]
MSESSAPPAYLRLLVRVVTPLVKVVLRSPAHGWLSRSMMLLTVTGRRTGRRYEIPISYVADGAVVTCITGIENAWWKNLRGGAEVTVLMERNRFGGHAEASTGMANVPVIQSFLETRPRDARFHHVRRDAHGQFNVDDLTRAAQTRVVINVQLWPES